VQSSVGSRSQYISNFLAAVARHRRKIEWLLSCGISISSVANFGCNIGYETVALAWLLNARDTVGIDKDRDRIKQGLDAIRYLLDDLKVLEWTLRRDTDHETADLARKLQSSALPSFLVADIRGSTGLRSDHFDLSYCERVLYQILCDDSSTGMEGASRAICEIARVTKSGGLVAAIEPTTCSPEDDTVVDLDRLFTEAGLVEFKECDHMFSADRRRTYTYIKPR
jgi:SAM-dependent methyltransferase